MKIDLRTISIRQGKVQRGIAVFFLIFSFLDLAADVGSLLLGDEANQSTAIANAVMLSPCSPYAMTSFSAGIGTEDSQEQPLLPASNDVDCFHCFSQGLPNQVFFINLAFVNLLTGDYPDTSLPSSPPGNIFHPPRYII